MFDHLLESSHRDKFGEEITPVQSIKAHFKHLIWSSTYTFKQTDLRYSKCGHVGLVKEDPPEVVPVWKHLSLTGKIGPARIHCQHRAQDTVQPVLTLLT